MSYTLFPRIPEARERIRKQLGVGPMDPLAIACGAIRPYKNIDAIIEAAARPELAGVTFVVAGGEGGYPDLDPNDALARTRRQVSKFGVGSQFRLIPRFLSTFEMAELFEAADIVLLPYQHGYGSGQLLLAMTFGKAIVATKVGGADEYLATYRAGHVIPEPTASAVSEGIQTVLAGPATDAKVDPQYRPAEVARTALVALGIRNPKSR
jgi:glycosyltransferase involved in cell wall biosynthesis